MTIRFVCCLLAVCISSLLTGNAAAQDANAAALSRDFTTVEFSKSYDVEPVREAIGLCLSGKFAEAVPKLKEYADQKDVAASYLLAILYQQGWGVEKSLEAAAKLLESNAMNAHAPSMILFGELKQESAPAEALQWFKAAANAGNAGANVKLGLIFEQGRLGFSPNLKLARTYFNKAYEKKLVAGTYHMARCFDMGIGGSQDTNLATRLYRESALAGVPQANSMMASRYFEGKGVEVDPVAAIGWLSRGAQVGDSECMVLLGNQYESGQWIGKSLNSAGQLYSQAAKVGDKAGVYHLALLYVSGTGTKPDPVRAYVLLDSALELPKAKELHTELSKSLSPEQLALAKKKIEEEKQGEAQR